jgi:chromosome segregation protein
MYLKTIDIVGFKSFADKTRVDLRPGITGVIGPNGCGKSNIMESIRWCIGEMSWKSLRSSSMVSIIFAGTTKRSPMNMCEVTLTFDNSQHLLPVQYSEISVSRRIYRSGESEYYLNKTQCRLRDIRELFLGTGMGNSGYAIIDQGGVDFVLSAKPEDRRALFEEAAGVSKYKAKKVEALRKLDRVDIDLGRLQDSVSLINEQIKKLDADARKANLFQKYKVELVAVEASATIQEIDKIDTTLKEEGERLRPMGERHGELRTKIEGDNARLSALSLGRGEQESAVLEANQKVAGHKADIGRLEERIDNAKSNLTALEAQLEESRGEVEREVSRAQGMDPDIDKAKQEYDGAAEAEGKAQAEVDAFQAEFTRLESEREAAQSGAADIKGRMLRAAEACQNASRSLSASESRIGQLDYEVRRTLKELEKKEQQISGVREGATEKTAALESQRANVESARAEVVRAETGLVELRARIEGLAQARLDKHDEAVRLKAKIEALEVQGQRDPYWLGAQTVVNAGLNGVRGTVRTLLDVADEDRSRIEDILGERLHAVVCEDLPAAKNAIEFLKGAGKGRARFLVASTLPEPGYESSIPAEARPVVERVRFNAENEKVVRFLLGEAYQLEDGLYGKHWVCGGSKEGETMQLKLSDIGMLTEKHRGLETELNALEGQKTEAQGRMPALEEALKTAQTQLSEQGGQVHRLEAEARQQQETLKMFEEEIAICETEAARGLQEMARVQEEIGGFKQDVENRRKEEEALRAEEAEAAQKLARLGEQLAAKQADKTHLERSLEQSRQQAASLKSQYDRFVADKQNLLESIERRKQQQEQWQQRREELVRTDGESKEKLTTLRDELAVFENEAKARFDKLQEIQREAEELGETLRGLKAEADKIQNDLHQAELKLSELKSRHGFLHQRLQEEWELTYEQAREKYKDQPVDTERIEFLRRRIASLGNVNMAAPEEYEELSGKRDKLQSQVDDLNQAKADLLSVIQKINATTRENFRQTFTEVRGHFRKLYATLFEGGEADVVLTDKENMLESGVDIMAQPPGKRLQSISQLSGGEKTLTAIALLFAFFMVKPSPICMLDEADAALDDANVERFATILREFGSKTQFLIVSHNKGTMEICDAIYGVTMEESGVSQLISVDFKGKKGGAKKKSEALGRADHIKDDSDEPDTVSA